MKSLIYLFLTALAISCIGKQQSSSVEEIGELKLDSIVVEEKIKLLPNEPDSVPHATLNIKFVYPSAFGTKEELQKLQAVFYEKVFGKEYADATSQQVAVERYIARYAEFYREETTEVYKENSSSLDVSDDGDRWFLNSLSYGREINNSIVFINENVMSFNCFSWDYTGGAHGNFGYSNHSIDLKTLKPIAIDEILNDNYEDELTTIIKSKLLHVLMEKLDNSVTDIDELKTYFFDFEKIEVTDNFMLTKTGMTFTYNPYEIAPYAAGVIEVHIPYGEMMNLLNPDAFARLLPSRM